MTMFDKDNKRMDQSGEIKTIFCITTPRKALRTIGSLWPCSTSWRA